mgnify:CR=1 FL=1
MSLLGLPYALVEIDGANRAHKTPEFLAMNAFGQVPVLQDGEVTLAEGRLWPSGYYLQGEQIRTQSVGTIVGQPLGIEPPAVWDGTTVYDDRGVLRGTDTASGVVRWSRAGDGWSFAGAPVINAGRVYASSGGLTDGLRVRSYDLATGKRRWRFYTVPGNPANGPDGEVSDAPLRDIAAKTWHGQWWKYGGGGTVWDSMAYDAELDLLYVGVGNGSPWNQHYRSEGKGDNLYLSSIVALRPKTGEYVWHFQTTPGETWDYTATSTSCWPT